MSARRRHVGWLGCGATPHEYLYATASESAADDGLLTALAKELKADVDHIVRALEADKGLPQVVEVKPAETVKNPFA